MSSVLHCIALCCTVLQCGRAEVSPYPTAGVLQCVAVCRSICLVCCNVLHCVALYCRVDEQKPLLIQLQVCCSVLQYMSSVLQCIALCCTVLQSGRAEASPYPTAGVLKCVAVYV